MTWKMAKCQRCEVAIERVTRTTLHCQTCAQILAKRKKRWEFFWGIAEGCNGSFMWLVIFIAINQAITDCVNGWP